MRILVTFALDQEFAPWRSLRHFRPTGNKAYAEHVARANRVEIRVAVTGVGIKPAQKVAREALAVRADVCISSGLAGSLKPEHAPGDVLVGRTARVCTGNLVLTSHPQLVQLAEASGATPVAAFCTAEQALIAAKDKARLVGVASAVEMESLAVMSEAEAAGTPCVAIRAVSDRVEEDLPIDFNRIFGARGEVSRRRVAGQLMRRPQRLLALIRLGRQAQRAAESLAQFLDRYVEALADAQELHSRATPVLGVAVR